jgi:hypothetical protein
MVVAVARNTGSTPRGPAIDFFFNFGGGCCREYWQHPPGGPPSTSSSTLVVAATGNTDSTLRVPAIDVFFNYGGACYREYRQHPQGARHRCLAKLGTCRQYFLATPTRGHYGKHYHYKQDKFNEKIFLGPCSSKNSGIITSQKFKSTNCGTM